MKTAPSCFCAHCRGAVTKPRVSTTCEPIGRGCTAPLGLRVRNCAHCRCWRTCREPEQSGPWRVPSACAPPCGCQSGACPIATSIPCLSVCRWSCRGSSRSGSLQPRSSTPLWVGLSLSGRGHQPVRATGCSPGGDRRAGWGLQRRTASSEALQSARRGSWPAYTTTQYVTLYLWLTTCAISSLHDPVIPISLHRPYHHRVIIGITNISSMQFPPARERPGSCATLPCWPPAGDPFLVGWVYPSHTVPYSASRSEHSPGEKSCFSNRHQWCAWPRGGLTQEDLLSLDISGRDPALSCERL